LHAHTNNSDGKFALTELVRHYEERGYDFLAVTDHDKLTSLTDVAGRLLLLSGCEVTAGGGHVVAIGITEPIEPRQPRQAIIDAINAQGGLAILAHPNWGKTFCHWQQDDLAALQGYAGIEVFNGNILRDDGSPLASDRWDRLLSQGRKVWGYATDDTHNERDIANGWTMVLADDTTPDAILKALRDGRCYASSGVFLEAIEVDGEVIRIVTRNADRIAFVGPYGRWLAWVDASRAEYRVRGDEGYVRVEAYGGRGGVAWTQPFWTA